MSWFDAAKFGWRKSYETMGAAVEQVWSMSRSWVSFHRSFPMPGVHQGNYLWAGKIKAIEGQHGSGVGSYFRFLRCKLLRISSFRSNVHCLFFQVSLPAQRGPGLSQVPTPLPSSGSCTSCAPYTYPAASAFCRYLKYWTDFMRMGTGLTPRTPTLETFHSGTSSLEE